MSAGTTMPRDEWDETKDTRVELVRKVTLATWNLLTIEQCDEAVRVAYRDGIDAGVREVEAVLRGAT